MTYNDWDRERAKVAARAARRRYRGQRWGDPVSWMLAGIALVLVLIAIQGLATCH